MAANTMAFRVYGNYLPDDAPAALRLTADQISELYARADAARFIVGPLLPVRPRASSTPGSESE